MPKDSHKFLINMASKKAVRNVMVPILMFYS